MTNRKSTKRALLGSVMAMVLCLAMLVGATFAWFTDTASTNVNKIQAGKLDIELQYATEWDDNGVPTKWENAEGKMLEFRKAADAAEGEQVLWEPGCTYMLPELRVVNNGNLAVKFEYDITNFSGDTKLVEVLEPVFSVNGKVLADGEDAPVDVERAPLLPGKTSDYWAMGFKMQETAGNEYQGLSLNGLAITVYATQAPVESDSFNNEYDKDADYGTKVDTADELKKAVTEGGVVVLNNDIDLTSALTVPADKEVVINLNGKTITAAPGQNTIQVSGKVTLNGNGTVVCSGTGKDVVAVYNGGELVVNGGTYVGNGVQTSGFSVDKDSKITVNNCVVDVQEVALFATKGGELVVNGGTFTTKDNFVIGTNGSKGLAGSIITVNGGTFNGNIQSNGYIACGVYVANNDTVNLNGGTFNITNGVGVLARAGQTTIGEDVVINLTNDGTIASGKVGDSGVLVPCTYVVKDLKASYPGTAPENFEVTSATYTVTVLEK